MTYFASMAPLQLSIILVIVLSKYLRVRKLLTMQSSSRTTLLNHVHFTYFILYAWFKNNHETNLNAINSDSKTVIVRRKIKSTTRRSSKPNLHLDNMLMSDVMPPVIDLPFFIFMPLSITIAFYFGQGEVGEDQSIFTALHGMQLRYSEYSDGNSIATYWSNFRHFAFLSYPFGA